MKLTQEQLIQKVTELKQSGGFDLSLEEDLSIAIMNLVSLEEHFFFTAEKTKKDEYFELLGQAREMRKQLLAKMIDRHEGETWCITKHLLAAAMRLMEVATKLQSAGKTEEAKDMFGKSYELYSLFWALRLKLVSSSGLSRERDELPKTKEDLIGQMLDCCKE
ncbi:MAG TPA: hypothetical protein VHA30_02460 [Patescibacteria group bacterium]|nr:hypothetical protein [Patescibacteria group bacterium]